MPEETSIRVKGIATAIKHPITEEWRADGSRSENHEWEGYKDGIESALTTMLESSDWDMIRIERGKVISRIIASVAVANDDEQLEAGVLREWWELDRNLVDIPLAMHEYFLAADMAYINILERNYLQPGVDPDWSGGSEDLAGVTMREVQYYYHRLSGVSSMPYSTYVLRRCRIVRGNTVANSNHTDVMRVVDLPNNVPTALIGVIDGKYEWLKQPPDVRQTERHTFQLAQEYWAGEPLWSIIYGGTWDPVPTGLQDLYSIPSGNEE